MYVGRTKAHDPARRYEAAANCHSAITGGIGRQCQTTRSTTGQ